MTKHFIVIGNPIAHSKSPKIHHTFAQQVGLDIHYARQLCPNNPESFACLVEAFFNGGGIGANVTVPFKQMAYALCQTPSNTSNTTSSNTSTHSDVNSQTGQLAGGVTIEAQVAQAVNTLYLKDGKLCGHNTDGQGLVNHLCQLGWQLTEAKVAIIGAGGASRGVMLPLLNAGVKQLVIANRTVSKAEALIADLQHHAQHMSDNIANTITKAQLQHSTIEALTGDFDIIINATSIGLSNNQLPLSTQLNCHHAYDMMYGQPLAFLQHFAAKNAKTSDGYGMLIAQAALSFEVWTGHQIKMTEADMHNFSA